MDVQDVIKAAIQGNDLFDSVDFEIDAYDRDGNRVGDVSVLNDCVERGSHLVFKLSIEIDTDDYIDEKVEERSEE